MFRSYKQQTPRKVSRKKSLPDDQSASLVPAVKQHPTLQMQSLIGNQATQRMIIQRMPSAGIIKATLGEPKADQTIGIGRFSKVRKNATKYRAVLAAVGTYDTFITGQLAVGAGPIQAQFKNALNLLDGILVAAAAYNAKDNKKARYMKMTLKPEVLKEKNRVAVSLTRVLSNPAPFVGQPLALIIMGDKSVTLKASDEVDKHHGGSSEVTEFGGANPGFFKENKNTLTNLEAGMPQGLSELDQGAYADEAEGKLMEKVGGDFDKYNALSNEYRLGVKMVGIDAKDARMAKRDVAMSRLDQLLGAGVIAKAQMAVQHTADGDKTGSLMEDATKKGKSAYKMAETSKLFDPTKGETQGATDKTSLDDPKLMQHLSRLQLMDLLALQVDRNTKNYYIQTDLTGKVVGIVGIDNDFSMGTNVNIEGRNQQLPGMSRYVDEELATAILNLDVEILKSLMADLLSEAEIAALITRLQKLQAFLKPLKDGNHLLKPDQWTPAIAKNLLDEKIPGKSVTKSYYGQFVEKVRGERAV